jgi:hypothetical protein
VAIVMCDQKRCQYNKKRECTKDFIVLSVPPDAHALRPECEHLELIIPATPVR